MKPRKPWTAEQAILLYAVIEALLEQFERENRKRKGK